MMNNEGYDLAGNKDGVSMGAFKETNQRNLQIKKMKMVIRCINIQIIN